MMCLVQENTCNWASTFLYWSEWTVIVDQPPPIKIDFVGKMALKWLNHLSSLLQHLYDLKAI